MTAEEYGELWSRLEEYRLYAVSCGYIDITYGIIKAQEILQEYKPAGPEPEPERIEEPEVTETCIEVPPKPAMGFNGIPISKCPICGKKYMRTPEWAYKIKDKKGRMHYYCRYKCWREASESEKIKKGRYDPLP